MKYTFENETLPSGEHVTRRYEDGVLVGMSLTEELPSGRYKLCEINPNGQLLSEMYSHGMKIVLSIYYKDGQKIDESYIVKKKLSSRKNYEKARTNFPDMPPADSAIEDHGAELLRQTRQEKAAQARTAKQHAADPKRAHSQDEFCKKLLSSSPGEDILEWLENSKFVLGEMSLSASRKLLTTLKTSGCPHVFACDAEQLEPQLMSAGKLVVELPELPSDRATVFKVLGRISQELGFEPTLDDGQMYCFSMLD